MGSVSSKTQFDPTTDLVDLKGKVAIVTGGNSGIGLETVRHLARAGAKVYLAARNESRATGAIKKLENEGLGHKNGEVVFLKLDLSDPRSAKKGAEGFLEKETRLDILINNAGIMNMAGPLEFAKDGVSVMTTVNYIGPYVFTRTLIPILRKTAREPNSDVRIVNVASKMHKWTPSAIKFDEIDDFNLRKPGGYYPAQPTRYSHGKFMVVLWTSTLQRYLEEDSSAPITAISIHPGVVDTFSYKHPLAPVWKALLSLFMVSPAQGCYTSLFAAAGNQVLVERVKYAGKYLEDKPTYGALTKTHEKASDRVLGEKLWDLTERFLKEIGQ